MVQKLGDVFEVRNKMADDVSAIITDDKYIEATAAIADALGASVNDNVPLIVKEICRKTFNASGCSREDLLNCLYSEYDELVRFAIRKWKYLMEKEEGDVQEFPKGEETDETDTILETAPIGRVFLIGYLCEFYLLKHKREDELTAYLKKRRIPGQKKYIKILKQLLLNEQS